MNKQSKNKKRLKKLAKESKAKIEKNRMAIEEYCYQQISHLEFLNELEKRSIAKSIARVPKNYARDSESIKDWWNYCQYPANFGGYLPHLNITICIGKLATILKRQNFETCQIASKRFSEIKEEVDVSNIDKKCVYYQNEDLSDVELKDEPIIILKDLNGLCRVIDGNHRATNAVKNNLPYLDAYIVDDAFITDNDCFGTRYDQELYFANKMMYDAYYKCYPDLY